MGKVQIAILIQRTSKGIINWIQRERFVIMSKGTISKSFVLPKRVEVSGQWPLYEIITSLPLQPSFIYLWLHLENGISLTLEKIW